MNFNDETLEWLQQIKRVVNDTKNINEIQKFILKENERLILYNKQRFTITNALNKNRDNNKEFRNLKYKENNLKNKKINRKYPELLSITYINIFKRIYY